MTTRLDSNDASEDVPKRSKTSVVAVLIACACCAIVAGAVWGLSRIGRDPSRTTVSSIPAGTEIGFGERYVGDKVCAECHELEALTYKRSGHATTLRPASKVAKLRELKDKTVVDPADPAVSWSFRYRDGALTVDRKAAGKTKSLNVSHVFGSGRHGLTMVTLNPKPTGEGLDGVEHRLTLYTHSGTWNVSPGHDFKGVESDPKADPDKDLAAWGRTLGASETRQCYQCHTTLVSRDDPNRLDPATLVRNVGCERCHGPGLDHVQAARAGDKNLVMALGPDRSEPEIEIRACGQCHRVPVFDSKISNESEGARVIRFQPIGLMFSRCFVKSGGTIACTTCHDPHDVAVAAGDVTERVCIDCHKAAPQSVCAVSPKSDCVRCHMPTRLANDGMSFVDHWIHIPPNFKKDKSATTGSRFSMNETSRKVSSP